MRIDFLGFPIDSLDMQETLRRVDEFVETGEPHLILVANANKLWIRRRDPQMERIALQADLVVPERVVVLGAAFLGAPLKSDVCGVALAKELLPHCEKAGHRIFFLGARPAVLETMLRKIRSEYPALQIAGYNDGYFLKNGKEELLKKLRAAKPDVLLVAMGSPLQEYWIRDNCLELGIPVALGVGGSFDVIAGIKADAPLWVRKCSIEWLFRFIQDPKNLWKRYSITIPWLLGSILAEKIRGRKPRVLETDLRN